MTDQSAFVAQKYDSRAKDYVASAVHAGGADLDQIEQVLKGASAARALDLGCGGGHVSYRAAQHVREVIACDVTQSMLDAVTATAAERGLPNIRTRKAAAENLPFEDGFFDFVLCRFTAHHWQDFEAGLRQAHRVLKSGGCAIFIDTVAPANPMLDSHFQTMELLRDASHVRNYTVAEWVAALARAGFGIESITSRWLTMEFSTWTARTKTPQLQADAIRALQRGAPPAMRDHFNVKEDGSFDLESVTFVLRTEKGI